MQNDAAQFSIGIDLGTTNSALAFAPLKGEPRSDVLAIPQRDSPSTATESLTLPSFLYLPEGTETAHVPGTPPGGGRWIVGKLAQRKARETPGRVAHSAKSWLCHHAADRSAPFLPWGSRDLPHDSKISPVRASALILDYLRKAWDARLPGEGVGSPFNSQDITIAVPASFDAAAQRLTLAAAQEAGFPDTVRLIEEPLAAFYNWLEHHDRGRDLRNRLLDPHAEAHHVLVIDVGGGTSDFSLLELRWHDDHPYPKIKRVAVGDHILVGGDNIDLAIAHLLEPRLAKDEGTLSGVQWDHLVAQCRLLKEQTFSREGPPDEPFPVAVPGRGSGLIAGSLSTQVTRAEVEHLLLDGFFPECAATDRPKRTLGALKEWGLPYPADGAITRHLAAFLSGRPRVDAMLFNGGSLHPQRVRDRLRAQIGRWQEGLLPVVLENTQVDLAVALGAAYFGRLLHDKAGHIEGGAAQAVFIEAQREPSAGGDTTAGPSLVCILPRGAAPEETFEIADLALQLRINRPVRFQTYSSTRHGSSKAGDVVERNPGAFHPLPPLETVVTVSRQQGDEQERTLPVILIAKMNDLGLLQVSCRSTDPDVRQSWPFDFNLLPQQRGPSLAAGGDTTAAQTDPGIAPAAIESARKRIETLFTQPLAKRDKLTGTRVFQTLEQCLGQPKSEWNLALVRALWPSLAAGAAGRALSVEHEEAWLILAGFVLRPGFGASMDDARIDALWHSRGEGLCFPNKRIKLQDHILWRRVAGGLSRERQESVLAAELDKIRERKNPPPELIRLAGALERLGPHIKSELINGFIDTAVALASERKHCAPYLSALGLLLNRTPLYAGPDSVVMPDLVERAYEAFRGLDWSDPQLAELPVLFLRAARVVDDRRLDLPRSLRHRIARRLEKCGTPPHKVARLRQFVPIERSERLGLYGEAMPPGLILSD